MEDILKEFAEQVLNSNKLMREMLDDGVKIPGYCMDNSSGMEECYAAIKAEREACAKYANRDGRSPDLEQQLLDGYQHDITYCKHNRLIKSIPQDGIGNLFVCDDCGSKTRDRVHWRIDISPVTSVNLHEDWLEAAFSKEDITGLGTVRDAVAYMFEMKTDAMEMGYYHKGKRWNVELRILKVE